MSDTSPYERNIAEQPEALRDFAQLPLARDLEEIDLDSFDRVILTGMGTSHYAAHPTWEELVRQGRAVWWVTTAQLLERPELITSSTLLWMTSQSGESGESVALLEGLGLRRPRKILATTNVAKSTLGQAADVTLLLHSGDEATVSTKSYVNSLACHSRAVNTLSGGNDQSIIETLMRAATEMENFGPNLTEVARESLRPSYPRFAFVAAPSETTTALSGSLIMKEASKVPVEGYVGGDFRHGPIEVGGPGLVVTLFGRASTDASLEALSHDLIQSGSMVIAVDLPGADDHCLHVRTPATSQFARRLCAARFYQEFSVAIARARGIEPGAFLFGSKITTNV
jgi:glucosamine--fructose-6-phosphate aminotransferase (isomerizing)